MGRFISRLGKRALPFFKLLKKTRPIEWTSEVDAAFRSLKQYLATPPILVAPRPDEPLLLYIAATNQMVSAVLVVEREVEMTRKGKRHGCLLFGHSSKA